MKGRLNIITGGMFAGKTTELIRILDRFEGAGIAIRHARDTRYAANAIVTHERYRLEAVTANNASELPALIGDTHCVGIDEAHFYDAADLANVVEQIITLRNVRVVVAGLQYDHEGNRFAWIRLLADYATTITYMRAECHECHMPATHQFCVTGKVENGGPDDFLPLCKTHFCERMEASE